MEQFFANMEIKKKSIYEKLITSLFVLTVGFASAQTTAFKGKDDLKFQIGANMQDGGTGM